MTFGSLFSGIGGLDLGLERAGFRCEFQVEKDGFCRSILAMHWPDVPRHDDVTRFHPEPGHKVDVLVGGFPCQDVSNANGRGAGIDGDKSSLWGEFARLLRTIRPDFAIVENSPNLINRGLGRVLGDLHEIGFDAEWSIVSACSLGAPHTRERLFILAHARRLGLETSGWLEAAKDDPVGRRGDGSGLGSLSMLRGLRLYDSRDSRMGMPLSGDSGLGLLALRACEAWGVEPPLCRVAHGFPGRVDRIRAFGNAVVPQVAEFIGRLILDLKAKEARP